MKKVLGLSVVALAGVLAFTGCGKISDKEGKAWAEENGYIKNEALDAVGEYVFEYFAIVDDENNFVERINSCDVIEDDIYHFSDCEMFSKSRLVLTSDGYFYNYESSDSNEKITSLYMIDEYGDILTALAEEDGVNPIGVYFKSSDTLRYENGRIYMSAYRSDLNSDSHYMITASYKKK